MLLCCFRGKYLSTHSFYFQIYFAIRDVNTMSTPSPDLQKGDLTYQSSETSDHGLLTHVHTCTCSDKTLSNTAKNETNHTHLGTRQGNLQQIVNTSHSSIHAHNVIHSQSPKTEHIPKVIGSSCTCHIQEDCENTEGFGQSGQGRKSEADDRIEVSPLPPALPPRPPPRPRYDGSLGSRYTPRLCK